MTVIEAIVLGGMVGTIVESAKRGLIQRQGSADGLPPAIKMILITILIGIPALNAGEFSTYGITLLATVGAFTVARWSVASAIALCRRRG